jgi:hypothetical protein
MATNRIGRRSVLGRSSSSCSCRFSGKSAAAADGKDEILSFFHSFAIYKAMQEWHNRIGDMLAYVNDVLTPHGFDEIVKDDFAALRQMVLRRR